MHDLAVRLLSILREVLTRHGAVTIREVDIDELMGVTVFDSHTIALSPDLSPCEWRSTLAHELMHLLRGPVPHRLAATEEAAVRHETATRLFPDGQALAELGREWSDEELQSLAARYGVDRGIIDDVVLGAPTLPFPKIPAPRYPAA